MLSYVRARTPLVVPLEALARLLRTAARDPS